MEVSINKILGNPKMALDGCFWTFDDNGNANQIRGEYLEIFNELEATLDKKALWIREMENYSHEIRAYCEKIKAVNCHMIIAPKDAVVLARHCDMWDVYIKMLHGSRRYEVEGKEIVLSSGEDLLIKRGEMHQVFPIESSITINFGIGDGVLEPLTNPYDNYEYNFAELFKKDSLCYFND